MAENWQVRVAALEAIASFGGDYAPDQLSAALPDVVPAVSPSMTDTKKQVKVSAKKAMGSACGVIGNRDIEHMTDRHKASSCHDY